MMLFIRVMVDIVDLAFSLHDSPREMQGGLYMSTYETLSLMISFSILVIAILKFREKK